MRVGSGRTDGDCRGTSPPKAPSDANAPRCERGRGALAAEHEDLFRKVGEAGTGPRRGE